MELGWIKVSTGHVVCDVALHTTGVGPSILFLHGWAHSSSVWQKVIPRIEGSYTCLCADLPGFGASLPLERRHASLERYAEVVWGLVHQLVKTTPIALVVADSTSGLLILDCLSRSEPLPVRRHFLSGVPLDGLPHLVRNVHAHAFTGLGLGILRTLPISVADFLTRRSNYLTVHRRGPFERIITEMARRSDPATASRLLREMYQPYQLGDFFVPDRYEIALCRGAHDQIFRAPALSPWANALGAVAITLPDLGHTPMLEGPDEYARAILEYNGAATAPVESR